MQLVSGREAVQRVRNLIKAEQQTHAYAVELTAKQLSSLTPPGAVAFGGSKSAPAEPHPVPTHQKHSQDRYQWWTLVHGAYQVEFNEVIELAEDEMALLGPHERLLRAGAEHPALFLRGKINPLSILLSVSGARLEIKQNARISTLRIFRLGAAGAAPKAAKAGKPAKKKR